MTSRNSSTHYHVFVEVARWQDVARVEKQTEGARAHERGVEHQLHEQPPVRLTHAVVDPAA